MKEKELRELSECAACNQKIGHTGLPLFWTATIERHGINSKAVQRQQGLAVAMGSAAVAMAMGPNEDMTTTLLGPVRISVCEQCAMESRLVRAAMLGVSA